MMLWLICLCLWALFAQGNTSQQEIFKFSRWCYKEKKMSRLGSFEQIWSPMHENQCFIECVYASEHSRLWTTTLDNNSPCGLLIDFWGMCHETNFLQWFCIWQKSDCQMDSHAHSLILCWAMQKRLTYNIISLQHIPCSRFKFKGRNNLSKKFPVYLTGMFYNAVKCELIRVKDLILGGIDIIEAVLCKHVNKLYSWAHDIRALLVRICTELFYFTQTSCFGLPWPL